MPHKFNAARRHKFDKVQYRVINGVLMISTDGRGELVSGSARLVSDGPIGGILRFEHPDLGVAGVGASPPVSDALFPVRRQEGGITTGVALHNLESSPGLVGAT